MSRWTPEQERAARAVVSSYEERIEQVWEDMLFDLQAQLGLDDEEVESLVEEVR